MSKVLFFEGAGMEGTQRNDVENCRIRTAFTNDLGQKIYLELGSGAGKNEGKLYVDFCHYITPDKDDCNESVIKIVERNGLDFSYTKKDILDLVNQYLNCSFDEIKILNMFSGYYVHDKTENGCNKYYLMDDYKDIPERTAERERIYNEVAKEYFESIYQKHVKANPGAARLVSKYCTWGIVCMDDKTMTLRSHTYEQLIDDEERVKVFDVIY